jgi:hypothetical protein
MDSDGVSDRWADSARFCFLTANDTVVQQPLRLENFTRTITDHTVAFLDGQGREARAAAEAQDTHIAHKPWFFFHSWFHVHTPLFVERGNSGRSKGGRFGDNVEELDDSAGRIMSALSVNGFDNNTVIFLLSDNGPYQEEGWDDSGRTNVYLGLGGRDQLTGRLKGGKGQNWEGGLRVPGAVLWPGVVEPGSSSDTFVSSMDIWPTALAIATGNTSSSPSAVDPALLALLPANYTIDGRDMTPILVQPRGGSPAVAQHAVFLHYCGFAITSARVSGRWKVFFAIQKWYTHDARNASVCLQCCNGVNPYSRITGATASELCGCSEMDLDWLDTPIVFDVALTHDPFELQPLTSSTPWPEGSNTSYEEVVSAANNTRNAMIASFNPKPDRSGAGQCTAGLPAGFRQPCCPGCSAFTLVGKCKDKEGKECTCG